MDLKFRRRMTLRQQ